MNITVVKRNGEREPYDANKINLAIERAAEGLEDSIAWVTQIASELELTLFDGISTSSSMKRSFRSPCRTSKMTLHSTLLPLACW